MDGNYEPSNGRWADMETQSNNRTTNINITYQGQTKTLKQWCAIYNLNYKSAHAKIRYKNYSFQDVLKENEK